jgi:transposase-like protein
MKPEIPNVPSQVEGLPLEDILNSDGRRCPECKSPMRLVVTPQETGTFFVFECELCLRTFKVNE